MMTVKRPKGLAKLEPPWTSKIHHLTAAEAREVWQYVVGLEDALEGYRVAFKDALRLKEEEAQP
jgi:hypothetical protein